MSHYALSLFLCRVRRIARPLVLLLGLGRLVRVLNVALRLRRIGFRLLDALGVLVRGGLLALGWLRWRGWCRRLRTRWWRRLRRGRCRKDETETEEYGSHITPPSSCRSRQRETVSVLTYGPTHDVSS